MGKTELDDNEFPRAEGTCSGRTRFSRRYEKDIPFLDHLVLIVNGIGNLPIDRITENPTIHETEVAQLPVTLGLNEDGTENFVDGKIVGILY
jgi:hypothetical protein